MGQKNLKPSSSYFLSQTFWRLLRNLTSKKIWTYFYKFSQKIKINSKLSELKREDLTLQNNLKYPLIQNPEISDNESFSYYLNKYKSSKPKGEYRKYLDDLFANLKNKVNTILELGVSSGAGIRSMKDYFYKSSLWGIDIDQQTFIKEKRIIECDWADQLKLETLKKSAKKFNTKIDLIVDDGWHHPESQINSMIAFLPYLNLGGVYIIEDVVHNDYQKYFLKVKDLLAYKKFQVEYKTFDVSGSDISNILAYFIIKRNN